MPWVAVQIAGLVLRPLHYGVALASALVKGNVCESFRNCLGSHLCGGVVIRFPFVCAAVVSAAFLAVLTALGGSVAVSSAAGSKGCHHRCGEHYAQKFLFHSFLSFCRLLRPATGAGIPPPPVRMLRCPHLYRNSAVFTRQKHLPPPGTSPVLHRKGCRSRSAQSRKS